ncbi:MAG: hypothetical protein H7336_17240 [Bacteriovorax sp.]|nr:hypothetical protein [Bacteriovorax sp.]
MFKMLLIFVAAFSMTSAFALTNSVVAESPDWSPVVLIKSEAPDSHGDSTAGYCNATFIGKNMMITAAHCIVLSYISKDYLFTIQTGYYKYVTRPSDGATVRIGYVKKDTFDKHVNIELPKILVDKIARQGEKAELGPTDDFAILWWNENTPEIKDMKYAEVATPAEHALVSKNMSAYPMRAVTINFFNEMSTDTKRMADLNSYKWNNGYIYSQSNSRVEEGDSGSPLFVKINNTMKIFAVVKGKASTIFSNWDVYPAVNNNICDLNKRMPTDMKIKSCN